MDIQPNELHQRCPIFCGSIKMVEKAEEFMNKYPENATY
jgi:fructose-1,6-bisphosphatase I